jgi:hypothetical protein
MEFTASISDAVDAQNIYKQVPAFHACKCQGKGISPKKKARMATQGKRG